MHFYEVKDTKVNGERYTKGYRLTFGKNPIEKAGFTKDDELEVTYKKDKIVITKKWYSTCRQTNYYITQQNITFTSKVYNYFST